MPTQTKKEKRRARQEELLKHFDGDFYQEKKIGEQWFVKQWNGNSNKWQVAIFSEQSFNKYKQFNEAHEQNEFIKGI